MGSGSSECIRAWGAEDLGHQIRVLLIQKERIIAGHMPWISDVEELSAAVEELRAAAVKALAEAARHHGFHSGQ